MTDILAPLVDALADAKQGTADQNQDTIKLAVIDNVTPDGAQILFDGEVVVTVKRYPWAFTPPPASGDVVVVTRTGSSWVITNSIKPKNLIYGSVADINTAYDTGWLTTGVVDSSNAADLGTTTAQLCRRIGNEVQLRISGTLPALTNNASSDIANTNLARVQVASFLPSQSWAGAPYAGGRSNGYVIAAPTGVIQITALGGTSNVAAGEAFSVTFRYRTD